MLKSCALCHGSGWEKDPRTLDREVCSNCRGKGFIDDAPKRFPKLGSDGFRRIAERPSVDVLWVGRFPRGHNAVEVRSARKSQTLTLYVTKTGLIRVFRGGKELK